MPLNHEGGAHLRGIMATNGVIDVNSVANLEVSEYARTDYTHASYVLSVAAHFEVVEKRGVDDGETVETRPTLISHPNPGCARTAHHGTPRAEPDIDGVWRSRKKRPGDATKPVDYIIIAFDLRHMTDNQNLFWNQKCYARGEKRGHQIGPQELYNKDSVSRSR